MTTAQLELNLEPLKPVAYEPEATNADRFAAFHAQNPHVADALEAIADQWFAAGNPQGSTKAFVERLRWESGVRTVGGEYRIDNRHSAFYSRLLLDRRPEWVGRIHQRRAQADHPAVA